MGQNALKRNEVAGREIMRNVGDLLEHLRINACPEYALPVDGTEARILPGDRKKITPTVWRPFEKEDISRYGLLINTYMGLLKKVLPDLKAVDHAMVEDVRDRLSDQELAQRLTSLGANVIKLPGLSDQGQRKLASVTRLPQRGQPTTTTLMEWEKASSPD